MNNPFATDINILIKAMQHLATDGIYCEDGVATSAIAEAADRLAELRDQVRDKQQTIYELIAASEHKDRLILDLRSRLSCAERGWGG